MEFPMLIGGERERERERERGKGKEKSCSYERQDQFPDYQVMLVITLKCQLQVL
jgi:hypothetical protein